MWSPKKNLRECHGYPARYVTLFTVQFALESLSSLPWNHCPVCRGISVQFALESLSRLVWNTHLDDMIGFAEKVIAYTDGFEQAGFVASGLNYDATVRNLELIGEAASNVPDEVRRQYPQIPWRMVVATRNKLIHGYLGVDNDTLWSIIQTDVPALLVELYQMKQWLAEGGAHCGSAANFDDA